MQGPGRRRAEERARTCPPLDRIRARGLAYLVGLRFSFGVGHGAHVLPALGPFEGLSRNERRCPIGKIGVAVLRRVRGGVVSGTLPRRCLCHTCRYVANALRACQSHVGPQHGRAARGGVEAACGPRANQNPEEGSAREKTPTANGKLGMRIRR